MKSLSQYFYIGVLSVLLLGMESCTSSSSNQELKDSEGSEISESQKPLVEEPVIDSAQADSLPKESKGETILYIPEGFVLFERIEGDLNGDGVEDCILIIKDTKAENIVEDEYQGELDRNRRGILVYLKKGDNSELVTENLSCFASENEDGGVYFPPQLVVEIENGKLSVLYHHGRYGFRKFIFRNNGSDFDLIGYDISENRGPIVNRETSINYLTKKKLTRVNVNQDIQESGEEVFEETWEDVELEQLIQLSEIEDFDSLEVE